METGMINLSRPKWLGIGPLDETPTAILEYGWSPPIRYTRNDHVATPATLNDPAAAR
jgi:hypothetical protein